MPVSTTVLPHSPHCRAAATDVASSSIQLISGPSLESLANETLTDIASYLLEESGSFMGLMLTSVRLAGVCEYLRYTSLIVQGPKGRRLLATLISGSRTASRYCRLIKRAWFKFWHDAEMYLVSALMCDALPLMVNLVTLRIDAHTIDEVHTISRLVRSGLVRPSVHAAYTLNGMWGSNARCTPWTLPHLSNVLIAGSFAMSSIVNHRALTEVTLESFLDYEDFADFVSSAEGTVLGNSLEVLSIRFVKSIDLRTSLPILSKAFPCVRRLSMEQSGMDIITVIDIMQGNGPTFSSVRYLALNRRLSFPLLKWGSKLDDCQSLTDSVCNKLQTPCSHLSRLTYVGVGRFLWVRSVDSRFVQSTGLDVCSWWGSVFDSQFAYYLYPEE